MKMKTLLAAGVVVLCCGQSQAADMIIGCNWCADPDLDVKRYRNVAYNAWFIDGGRWHAGSGGPVRAQVLVQGASGWFGPKVDMVLVQFEYEWKDLDFGADAGPFGRIGYNGPLVVTQIKVTAQTPSGNQYHTKLLPNTPRLLFLPKHMAYPEGSRPPPPPPERPPGPRGGGGGGRDRSPGPPNIGPEWWCVDTGPGKVECFKREL